MIQPEYSVYIKTTYGLRDVYLNDIVEINITFRWNAVTQWSLSGTGLNPCPVKKGTEIIIYRNEAPVLSGYVTNIEDNYDAITGIYDWIVEGEDDIGKLKNRVIYPNPSSETIQPKAEYSATGPITDVLLDAIEVNAGTNANISERQISTIDVAMRTHYGETITVASKYDTLLEFILKSIENNSLCIRSSWNGRTGISIIELYIPKDVSDTVVFSVEAGSLSGWKRTQIAPKANWILVCGCEITDSEGKGTGNFQTITVFDTDSIEQWGRIEKYITHTDISPIEEKDEEGNVTYRESWEDCYKRLQEAAMSDLVENEGQDGYELTVIELDRMEYKKHWDIGDKVTVRIADTEFIAPIKEIKVSYSEGIEKVSPSVGKLQKGELESIFSELGELKQRVKILQSS